MATRIPPRPPDRLIDRITPGVRLEHREADRTAFDESGQRSVREIERGLGSIGRELASFTRVLDFGCGCARVLRWLEDLAQHVEVHGCDIDALAIEWAADNLPSMKFVASDPLPPLPYPDDYFDLIVNHSVLTHLDEPYQDRWLPELRRVLQPGGIALLSVHGTRAFNAIEQSPNTPDPAGLRRRLEEHGIVHFTEDDWLGGAFPAFYHSTIHATWYVFEHWTRWFDIRAYLPHADLDYQDMVILEKVPEGDLPRPVLARTATGAPPAPVVPAAPPPVRAPLPLKQFLRRAAGLAVRGVVTKVVGDKPDLYQLVPVEPAAVPAAPAPGAPGEIPPVLRLALDRQGNRLNILEDEMAKVERILGTSLD